METSFKTCLFGGFDREDVISFIEKTAAETQERLDALTTEREELLAKKRSAEAENAALRVQLNELTERLAEYSALLHGDDRAALLERLTVSSDRKKKFDALRGLDASQKPLFK